ncbi:hypothetical protein NDU88_011495 [Pleurodeles waltl]|uniref:Uncharacterized protein n=1 Tax=Pleurodeles waltl TaxID=8319 RepID=A0AAV7S405_PLEWA|nr:hypothetical protein NDU88_011495 [Pleurodeles waltl]
MQSPAESRCCGATSPGCDDVTGLQALRWHRAVMDVGLTTPQCQRSRGGSAAAASRLGCLLQESHMTTRGSCGLLQELLTAPSKLFSASGPLSP